MEGRGVTAEVDETKHKNITLEGKYSRCYLHDKRKKSSQNNSRHTVSLEHIVSM